MPRKAAKGLYVRGRFWLDWDVGTDGARRSPYLTIFWYDAGRGRIRSASARTADLAAAKAALDRRYLAETDGDAICPTCGQRRTGAGEALLLRVITDYLAINEEHPSIGAIRPRLAQVIAHVADLATPEITCSRIDERWIEGFRKWLAKQPVILSTGATREKARSASTVENSVIQLAAAINWAKRRGDIARPAQFKPIQTKELNQTPVHRLSVDELAKAFGYATDPRFPEKRLALHRFLMISVATAARPDAAHDFSTDPKRRQWNASRSVVVLNPAGRRQTRKRRATVIAPPQFARCVEGVDGMFVPAVSVKSAWKRMVVELGWPRDGEGGTKLIRRSVAQLLRDAGTPRAWSAEWKEPSRRVPTEEIELQLGHREINMVTDLYAAFDPDYLAHATAAIGGIISAIEQRCPSAFLLARPGSAPEKSS